MSKIIGIYKIISPNKKVYIGQSVDIKHRFYEYRILHCKRQTKLYNSFIKYGVDKHKFEILQECEREQLNELEIYYIELYQCFNSEYGLNLLGGGNGCRHSDETKKKIGDAHRGEKHHMFGKKLLPHVKEAMLNGLKNTVIRWSEESKRKQSEARKGKAPMHATLRAAIVNKGKHLKLETRQKISLSHIGKKRKPFSEQCRNNMSLSHMGKSVPKEQSIKSTINRKLNNGYVLQNDISEYLTSYIPDIIWNINIDNKYIFNTKKELNKLLKKNKMNNLKILELKKGILYE